MAPMKRKREPNAVGDRIEEKIKLSSGPQNATSKEETPFPRGGGGVLTPLEHRQIQNQAKRDVLFEEGTGRKAPKHDFEDDENEPAVAKKANEDKPKHTKRSHKKAKAQETRRKSDARVYIDSLSYKRLVPGFIILGQVAKINRDDITLNLPNNLSGYVPFTSISDVVTGDLVDSTEDNEKNLGKLFFVGQYLRAYVVSTQESSSNKRHIELSIKPQHANYGLTREDCVENSTIQASVASVEDHGMVMDLGFKDKSVRGFISSKKLGSATNMSVGSVHLCFVTENGGKTIQLSMESQRRAYVKSAPRIDSVLPGTAIEVLVSDMQGHGIAGKFMGLIDVTADLIHSGMVNHDPAKFSIGTKVTGRIISAFPASDEKKLGISLLDHIAQWKVKTGSFTSRSENADPMAALPISAVVQAAQVTKVEPDVGLFLDVDVEGVQGFVHISKISDGKIESLSESTGSYRIGSRHKARVLGYNMIDGLFILSLEPSVINQPFLRIEDVKVGEIVKGIFEKFLFNEEGTVGALVELTKGVTGMIPEMHFADIRLQYPERKFKEGAKVTGRVLSVDLTRKRVRLTMKKSLVNSDAVPWTTYNGLTPGMQSPGTLVNILPQGAVVQFYGHVRAFLPVAEMSESFIRDPKEHFQKGQVVNVRILSVDAEGERLTVSCKDPTASAFIQQTAISSLTLGQTVSGKVIEKTDEEFILELEELHGIRGNLAFEHLTDGSVQKALSSAKRVRVGQSLSDIILLYTHARKNRMGLTGKPSLVKAAKEGRLARSIDDLEQGSEVVGYVNNITTNAVFVRFAGDLTGLLLRQNLPEEALQLPDFGYRRNQSISVTVMRLDHEQGKILLTKKPIEEHKSGDDEHIAMTKQTSLSNPVDEISTTIEDYVLGKVTKARVVSVKETQLNVQLADGVQGRIDMSEIFDKWSEIKDRKHPLKFFHLKQVLPVRILGMHDSRNHRFLPISHRQGRVPVFELTAKAGALESKQFEILSIDQVKVGSSWLAFVNNVNDDYLWVNLSPNVRGRIRSLDVSDDISLLRDMSKNFPVGSALRVSVVSVDVENNHLDLSARSDGSTKLVTLQDLSPGMVLPGRVTKVTDRQIMIQLNENLSGSLHLIDMTDDFDAADPSIYQKNQTVRVCIKEIDRPNKRISFSTRPSKVLSSSLRIRDRDITSISQLKVNDVVRGFIKNITDQGIFVSLSSSITAFVRVSDLSDGFIKDWKSEFEIDRLVEGRLIAVDPDSYRVQMSLKKSQLDSDYRPPIAFTDLEVGQVVSGKIRKVEDFGVFVVVDNSANVSGLCHRSQISDEPSAKPKALYEEGDAVKAKVLSIEPQTRRISFGLRASYFSNVEGLETSSMAESDGGAESSSEDADKVKDNGPIHPARIESLMNDTRAFVHVSPPNEDDVDNPIIPTSAIENRPVPDSPADLTSGLGAGGFDWTGGLAETEENHDDDDSLYASGDSDASHPKKKRAKKPTIKVDRTGDLDTYGPQTSADFERLLLGQPNASVLWLQYMAFHLRLGEIETARSVAERALKTIHIRESEEKLNVWIALLNLENTYGTAATMEAIFARACQYNDPQEIHERLTSIYIQSGKNSEADDLFQATLKKFSQSPALYHNYATFLFTHTAYDAAGADRARAILPRAMQTLPEYEHIGLTSKFAQLEFKHGDPERGRTIFENMVAQWPKRLDLWNVLLDMEIGLVKSSSSSSSSPPPSSANAAATTVVQGTKRKKATAHAKTSGGDQSKGDATLVRRLFERILLAGFSQPPAGVASIATAGPKLKPKKAKFFFKKWLAFEERLGDTKDVERVKGLATEYVQRTTQS